MCQQTTPFLREKAGRHDPRQMFYRAMLGNDTYEGYLAQVGDFETTLEDYKANPTNGRMEILLLPAERLDRGC